MPQMLPQTRPTWCNYPMRISKTVSRWRCHWNFWILLRMFWLNHSCVLRQFFGKINHWWSVFHTIYKSFPMSSKSILWKQNTYGSNSNFYVMITRCWNAPKLYVVGGHNMENLCKYLFLELRSVVPMKTFLDRAAARRQSFPALAYQDGFIGMIIIIIMIMTIWSVSRLWLGWSR